MKLIYPTLITCMLITMLANLNVNAQDFDKNDTKWLNDWTNFEPNTTNYPDAQKKLPSVISDDTYLKSDMVYLLSGDVYVSNNSTLTIQKGTVIRCDSKNPANLIITKGSKLIAKGSKKFPIVFTSDKPANERASGDWGGIIIAGNGKINSSLEHGIIEGKFENKYSEYGGTDLNEQTTVLNFVRIEFPGNKVHSNGLSLYSLGKSSWVSNVMVSHSGQDSFQWNGGMTNINNIISYKAKDDDFQFSDGYKGDLNNVVAIRHPLSTSSKKSYAIEIDGFNTDYNSNLVTDITISNATLINLSTKYKYTTSAISATNAASIYLNNSKISGFSDIVEFDRSYSSIAMINALFQMDNSFYNIHGEGVKTTLPANKEALNILKFNRYTNKYAAANLIFSRLDDGSVPNFDLKKSKNNYMVMH